MCERATEINVTKPLKEMQRFGHEQVVFIQAPDGAVRRITPKLGLAGVTHSEVTEGLAQGEKVATQVELPGAKAAKEKGKP